MRSPRKSATSTTSSSTTAWTPTASAPRSCERSTACPLSIPRSESMNWKVKYINYPLHFQRMEAEVMETVRDVLSRGDLILRKQTEDFEANLAAFCGTRYAIGVGNCTEALYLAYRAAGIGPGDEVITVAHTFVATVAMLVKAGATPVLVDIGDDHNVDPNAIEAAITPRTTAIVPVSLNGRCCGLPRIKRIAEKHNLVV